MSAVKVQATVSDDGTLTVKGLPSLAGHEVDVTVRDRSAVEPTKRYPLRGTPIQYEKPFAPVAEDEWSARK